MPQAPAQVALEVGHIRACERLVPLLADRPPSDFQYDQRAVNSSLADVGLWECEIRKREQPGAVLQRVALHDDVCAREAQRVSEDPARWEMFIAASRASLAAGTGATVHAESSFVIRGRELQAQIMLCVTELGLSFNGQHVTLPTTDGAVDVKIGGFSGVVDATHPSCAVLDLAWTEWRLQHHGQVYTILPKRFKKEQRQCSALAALVDLPARERVTTLFTDQQGRITEEMNWGPVRIVRPNR